MLFGGYSYDNMSAGIWVIHRGPKSGGELLTLFGGYSYDGVSNRQKASTAHPQICHLCMHDPYTSTHTIIRVTAKKRQQLTPRFATSVCMTHITALTPS